MTLHRVPQPSPGDVFWLPPALHIAPRLSLSFPGEDAQTDERRPRTAAVRLTPSPARTQLEPGPSSLQGRTAASPSGTGNLATTPICYLWHYLAHRSKAQPASAGSLGLLHSTAGALARFAHSFSSGMCNFSLSSPYLSSKA